MSRSGITILGLGPGDPALLTRQAWDVLTKASEIHLRTRMHPTIAGFPAQLKVYSFDYLYEEGANFEEVYEDIVSTVLTLGQREAGVVYGVPGHPFVAEATTPEITRRAKIEGVPVSLIEGLSFVDSVFGLLEVDPFPHLALVDALELAGDYHPQFPPSAPVIIAQIHSPAVASNVKLTLMGAYPDDHPVQLVHNAGSANANVESIKLYEMDRSTNIGLLTALYVPPLDSRSSFEGFQDVVAHLRAPEGCPWDREQTHRSLRPFLLEETYEVLSALDEEDQDALSEELGDLLLQIILHAQIASEYGAFNMVDVLKGIQDKLIRRHPHVFGDLDVDDKDKVLENWEKLKSAERNEIDKKANGVLEGVSASLPALVQAETYQERVNRVGFDWPNVHGVFEKIEEEILEVKRAESQEEKEDEIGDLLFAVVNLARWMNIDAESALRSANTRFRKRFEELEKGVQRQGRDVSALTMEELDALWNAVKKK
ncbi:MAG: nucleoside triphosphate pyrophosphohydrolase [Chloroflexota bacterium]|nr:MAG: nucleoside triphosphate pyrophosphohydrolase [Chloroflexota bacterium]